MSLELSTSGHDFPEQVMTHVQGQRAEMIRTESWKDGRLTNGAVENIRGFLKHNKPGSHHTTEIVTFQ